MNTFTRFFLTSTGSALVLAAILKIADLFQGARVLYAVNGLIGIENRFVYGTAAVVELAIAAFLIIGRNPVTKAFSVLWLATSFGAYRAGNWWLDIPKPCSCLGQIGDWIPLLSPYVETIAFGLLAWFFAGSLTILGHRLATERRRATARESKEALA